MTEKNEHVCSDTSCVCKCHKRKGNRCSTPQCGAFKSNAACAACGGERLRHSCGLKGLQDMMSW